MVQISQNVEETEWNRFLNDCDAATIYHTPAWKNFILDTFGYKSCYLFACDENGHMVGLLPLFKVDSKLTGKRLCSIPLSDACSYIGDPGAFKSVIDKALELYKDQKLDYLEIRDLIDSGDFQHTSSFYSHVIELSKNPDEVWMKFPRKHRKEINRANNKGIVVNRTEDPADLRAFYEILCITKRELGVPCYSKKYLDNIFKHFYGHVSLYVSRYEGRVIAGAAFLYFKKNVSYILTGADPGYLKLSPYFPLVWKALEDSCLAGYASFNYGRTSKENIGLAEYKRKWGVVEKDLYYSYYPKSPNLLVNNRKTMKYTLATKVIKKMPMPVYKTFSDTVFRNFV